MNYRHVRKILLVSLSCIGDVILTTPVMKVLRDNFPGCGLTVVAGPTVMPILKRHEWVHEAIVFENKGRHKGFSGASGLVRELRAAKYDMVVDLRNSAIPYFLRCRYRITAHQAHLRNKKDMTRHAVDRHLDVLQHSGIPITSREMKVTVPSDTDRKVMQFMSEKGIGENECVVAVYPGAGSPYKQYPVEKYVEALRMVSETGDYRFVTVGSGVDREDGEKLVNALGGTALNVAGDLDLLECGAILKHSKLLVTNDSGPMHLGVAVGTPVVAVFGPTNANRYGPRGDKHRIVWHKEPCNPCKFPNCGHDTCIGNIDPKLIADAAIDILGKKNV